MESSPAPSSRPREPLLFGSFDIPAGWGCRKPMAFCLDRDTGAPAPAPAPAAAEPDAVVAAEAKNSGGTRSPARGTATAQQASAEDVEAQAPEAPRRQWNLRERTSWRDYRAEDARKGKKLGTTDAGGSRRFSVALTRQEIDADFAAITGRKAPRRPRKRTRSVQRKIETLCPGSSLMEVTRDRYKVNEKGGF